MVHLHVVSEVRGLTRGEGAEVASPQVCGRLVHVLRVNICTKYKAGTYEGGNFNSGSEDRFS